MTSRTLRVLLLLTAFGAVVAGTLVVFGAERNLTLATAANAGFDAQARAVVDEIGRLRGAQQALRRRGPGHRILDDAGSRAPGDRATGASSSWPMPPRARATRSAVQAAAASLEQFRSLDKRARQYVQNNQSLMASDVIFTESLGALTSAGRARGSGGRKRAEYSRRRERRVADAATLCRGRRSGAAAVGRAVAGPRARIRRRRAHRDASVDRIGAASPAGGRHAGQAQGRGRRLRRRIQRAADSPCRGRCVPRQNPRPPPRRLRGSTSRRRLGCARTWRA